VYDVPRSVLGFRYTKSLWSTAL